MEALRYTIESEDRKNCGFVEMYYVKFLQTPGNEWSLVISKEGMWPPIWKYKVMKIPPGMPPKKLLVSHHVCPGKAMQETYQSMRLPGFWYNPSESQYLFSWLSMYSQDPHIQHWSKKCVQHLKPIQSHISILMKGRNFLLLARYTTYMECYNFETFLSCKKTKAAANIVAIEWFIHYHGKLLRPQYYDKYFNSSFITDNVLCILYLQWEIRYLIYSNTYSRITTSGTHTHTWILNITCDHIKFINIINKDTFQNM